MIQNQDYSIESLLLENREIYQVPDDRLYTVDDLLYNHQRFLFRFKEDLKADKRETLNLDISTAWFLTLINRFHIDLERLTWQRYSFKCPFCLQLPCSCKKNRVKAKKTGRPASRQPQTLAQWQAMIKKIYPQKDIKPVLEKFEGNLNRLNYLFRLFMREKRKSQFTKIEKGSIDHFVLILRIYNSIDANLTRDFKEMFKDGCYVCHQTPCQCNYFE